LLVIGYAGRFFGLLRSGSVVIKATRYREWFHGVLEPYKHYIPINYNFTDLVEKVAWIHRHPKVAERMTEASRERVETALRWEDMMCYVYRLMLEYQTLFEEQ
jgi:glycosyltransferase involved in cell wall biosynthesis